MSAVAPTPAQRPRVLLVTPGDADAGRIAAVVDAAVRGGVDTVLVREPLLSDAALVRLVARVVATAAAHGARVLVSERFDVAIAARAAGVHLKSGGLDPAAVRARVPSGFAIGLSAHRADEIAAASRAAAVDYCTIGPLNATAPGKTPLGIDGLSELLAGARVDAALTHLVVLGGVVPADGPELAAALRGESWGMAAIRPFFEADGPAAVEAAARAFRAALPNSQVNDEGRGTRISP